MPTTITKIVPVLLIMAMLVPGIAYIAQEKMINTASALVPVIDKPGLFQTTITAIKTTLSAIYDFITSKTAVAQLAFNTWIQNVFKVLLEYFKLKLLDMLSTQIVNWITGGKLGGPQYITNWSNFLGQAAQDAMNIVINEVDKASGGLICTPFANQLRNLLRVNVPPGIPGFQYSLSCSLDKVVDNINLFYSDFSRGGWAGYITLIQPNNNYYGNMVNIMDYEQQLEAAKQRAAQNEGLASQGFLSVKRCKVKDYSFALDEASAGCSEWEITTPGKALAATVDSAVTNRFGYIFGMNQFASIIAILVDGTLNKLIGVGVNGLMGVAAGTPPSNPGAGYIPIGTDFINCDVMPPGPDRDACLVEQQAHAPDVTFTPSVTVINLGDSFSLIWAGINTTSCTGINFSTGGQSSGQVTLQPTVTTSYSVTCANASGQTATQFTTVTVVAIDVFFTLSADTIDAGDSFMIAWDAKGATTCTGTNFDTGGQIAGRVTLTPDKTTTYSLTCRNASGGEVTKSGTVVVL